MAFSLDYRDALTGMTSTPADGTYSIVSLCHEHRERFVFHTSVGDIILRRLPLRLHNLLEAERRSASKHVDRLMGELQAIIPKVDGIPVADVPPDVAERVRQIQYELAYSNCSALGVIEAPAILTMEDYDDLVKMLTEEERSKLFLLVNTLASVRPVNEVDTTDLVIAERYGLQIIDETMFGQMTVSQANFWRSRINSENEQMRREREAMMHGI